MKNSPWAIIVTVLIVLLAAFAGVSALESTPKQKEQASTADQTNTCRNFTESTITIGEKEVSVAIADTPDKRSLGLSGCEHIPDGVGMYFAFETPSGAIFWMKDMQVPIDIVWIADDAVVGIESHVQPQPEVPDSELTRYGSPQIVSGVLELAAGQAEALDITQGTPVEL